MDAPPERCPPAHYPAAVRRHGSIHRFHGPLSLHARKRYVLRRKASSAGGVHRRAEGGGRLGNNLDFSALVRGVHQVGLYASHRGLGAALRHAMLPVPRGKT